MDQLICANSATLPITLVDGKHGHIVLIMKYTLYIKLSAGTPWLDPTDPGMRPTITEKSTVMHCQKSNETHGRQRKIYDDNDTMDEALRYQVK